MKVRGKEMYIIVAIIVAVLIVAWYFLLLSPTRSDIADLESQVAAETTALATAKNEVARLEQYKKTAPQSRADIVRLSKMLPGSEGMPSLIVELGKTADTSGVELVGITRGTTQVGNPFGVQAMTLQVEGEFFDIEDYLYRLEDYVTFRNSGFTVTGRLLQVQSVQTTSATTATSGGSPVLQVTVVLNAYLWGGAVVGGAQ